MDDEMNRDEFLFVLYVLSELLESDNMEGAKRVIRKAINQAERKESRE